MFVAIRRAASLVAAWPLSAARILWPGTTVAYNETVAVVIDQAAGARFYGQGSHDGMVLPENIDSGRSNSQLDTRHSGCRRTLDHLLSIHSMKHAAVSSTDQGGGKRRAGMVRSGCPLHLHDVKFVFSVPFPGSIVLS